MKAQVWLSLILLVTVLGCKDRSQDNDLKESEKITGTYAQSKTYIDEGFDLAYHADANIQRVTEITSALVQMSAPIAAIQPIHTVENDRQVRSRINQDVSMRQDAVLALAVLMQAHPRATEQFLPQLALIGHFDWKASTRLIAITAYAALEKNEKEVDAFLMEVAFKDGLVTFSGQPTRVGEKPEYGFLTAVADDGATRYRVQDNSKGGSEEAWLEGSEAEIRKVLIVRQTAILDELEIISDSNTPAAQRALHDDLQMLNKELVSLLRRFNEDTWYVERKREDIEKMKKSGVASKTLRKVRYRLRRVNDMLGGGYYEGRLSQYSNGSSVRFSHTNRMWAKQFYQRRQNGERLEAKVLLNEVAKSGDISLDYWVSNPSYTKPWVRNETSEAKSYGIRDAGGDAYYARDVVRALLEGFDVNAESHVLDRSIDVSLDYVRALTPDTTAARALEVISKRLNLDFRARYYMQHLLFLTLDLYKDKAPALLNDLATMAHYDWSSKSRRLAMIAFLGLNTNRQQKIDLLDRIIARDGDRVLSASDRWGMTGPVFEFTPTVNAMGARLFQLSDLPAIGIENTLQPTLKLTESDARNEIAERIKDLEALLTRLRNTDDPHTQQQTLIDHDALALEIAGLAEWGNKNDPCFDCNGGETAEQRIQFQQHELLRLQLPIVTIAEIENRLQSLREMGKKVGKVYANGVTKVYSDNNKLWAQALKNRLLQGEEFSYQKLYREGVKHDYLRSYYRFSDDYDDRAVVFPNYQAFPY